MRRWIEAALPLLGVAAATTAQAVGISAVTPRGEVAQLRQVTVTFSEAVVPLGDLRGADPMALDCRGPVPPGSGRWINERTWVYDFRDAAGPGVRCTLRARPEWRPLAGSLNGATEFAFGTGGPAVVSAAPYDGSEIDEDQNFLLRLSGAADPTSVEANAWCEVEGIGERLPLRTITGAPREQLLASRRIAKAEAERTLVASCARPLPNGAAVRLIWGKGIATAAAPAGTAHSPAHARS
jgi:alpha-2-macroglobulin